MPFDALFADSALSTTRKTSNVLLLIGADGGQAVSERRSLDWASSLRRPTSTLMQYGSDSVVWKEPALEACLASAARTQKPTSIVLVAHGVSVREMGIPHEDGSSFSFWYGEKIDWPLTSRAFFEMISDAFGKTPVDLVLLSCCAGAALADLSFLPKGSCLSVPVGPDNQLGALALEKTFEEVRRAPSVDAVSATTAMARLMCSYDLDPAVGLSGQGIWLMEVEGPRRPGAAPFSVKVMGGKPISYPTYVEALETRSVQRAKEAYASLRTAFPTGEPG